jgi:sporulation integral membrane protein YlbJ
VKLLLCILLILIIYFIHKLVKISNKSTILTVICSVMIVYFIMYPKFCMSSTLAGVKIFFTAVFPSLFPFMIICNILLLCDGVNIYAKAVGKYLCAPLRLPISSSFVLIVSALCGYPLGAKYACELYEKKIIDTQQCERLLNIASNAGPLFVIGSVGTSMFLSPQIGYILLISNYISCLVMGLLLPNGKRYNHHEKINLQKSYNSPNIGEVLKESIENAVKSALSIGGYITIFFVITDIIKNNVVYNIVLNNLFSNSIAASLISGLVLGFVELTKGCYVIANTEAPMIFKVTLAGFLLGFSGMSIVSQVYSFTYKYSEFSILKYIKRKLIQGLICSVISALAFTLFLTSSQSTPTFSGTKSIIALHSYGIIFLLVIPFIMHNLKKLFHIS